MKKLFTIIFTLLVINVSNAQFISSGVAVTAVTPMGDFSDQVGTGYGGVFMAKFGLIGFDVTGSVEYLSFSENEIESIKFSSIMWSVNAGARFSVLPFISAGAEIGNYWITVTADNGTSETNETVNKISFTPLISAQFAVFEASIRYALIDKASFIALRAGIYF